MTFRLVCTLGPASKDTQILSNLLAGATHFRLNGSHLNSSSLENWLERLSALFEKEGKELPVIVDLQGSKMRVGVYEARKTIPNEIRLVHSKGPSPFADVIPVPHERLFRSVKVGEELTLNDKKIHLRVMDIGNDGIKAKVVTNGPLSSNKGINRSDHPVPFEELTANDGELVQVAEQYSFVSYALSFITQASDIDHLRAFTQRPVAAKIERPEALENLKNIINSFDELWFCRGDLGAQAGLSALGPIQLEFENMIADCNTPALLAGQVLEHMTYFPMPTRTEVVSLHRAIVGPWDGIILSDETAIGKHPCETVAFINELTAAKRA